jgi:pimeloyl-ACP methyl ester carboxylesterase
MAVPEDLPGLAKRYGSITVPVGVLFGTGDRVLDHRLHGEDLAAQLPGLDLELVETGGHMLPISAPDRCARFIVQMGRRLPAETAPASQGDLP